MRSAVGLLLIVRVLVSTIGYIHFDSGLGGSSTKCPTYDNFHVRRNNEVEKAEAAALKQVRAENPNLAEEDLKINFKEAVKSPPRPYRNPMLPPPMMGFPHHPRFPNIVGLPAAPPDHRPRDPRQNPVLPAMNRYPNGYQPGEMPQPRIRPRRELQRELENMRRTIDEAHALHAGRNGAVNVEDRIRMVQAEVARRAQARAERNNDIPRRRPHLDLNHGENHRENLAARFRVPNRADPDYARNLARREMEREQKQEQERVPEQKNGGRKEQEQPRGHREWRRDGL